MTLHYSRIFDAFHPKLIEFEGDYDGLGSAIAHTNLLICGEVHGVKENADILYTLCHKLSIEQLGIECSPTIRPFLESAVHSTADFSLIDPDVFQSSILSIEMAKTIATIVTEGYIKEIFYLDTFYADDMRAEEIEASPQKREQQLADNVLNLDLSKPTVCLMGQWHTQPNIVHQMKREGNTYVPDTTKPHYSALYRARLEKPDVTFLHNIYKSGTLRNTGRVLELPFNESLPDHYAITRVSDVDFDLAVPSAHETSV